MNGTLTRVIDLAAGSPTITNKLAVAGAARLYGVYVNTAMSAHAITLKNIKTSTSPNVATTVATIPASSAAGTMINFPGIRFDDNLYVVTNASGTGSITVVYQPRFQQA